jgi:hypothetical protein
VTVRIVVPASEPQQPPRGIEETVAPREVELHIARTASGAGDGSEVVLAHDHCATLDAILRATHGEVFGSARFDCELADGGHVRGDFELVGGSYEGPHTITGHVEASGDALAHVAFAPDQGQLDPRGAVFWDRRYPRVVFEVDQAPADDGRRQHTLWSGSLDVDCDTPDGGRLVASRATRRKSLAPRAAASRATARC